MEFGSILHVDIHLHRVHTIDDLPRGAIYDLHHTLIHAPLSTSQCSQPASEDLAMEAFLNTGALFSRHDIGAPVVSLFFRAWSNQKAKSEEGVPLDGITQGQNKPTIRGAMLVLTYPPTLIVLIECIKAMYNDQIKCDQLKRSVCVQTTTNTDATANIRQFILQEDWYTVRMNDVVALL